MVPEHLEVETVDDVELLAEQQRAVAALDQRRIVRRLAAVDLPPGLERGRVDDARRVELLDLRRRRSATYASCIVAWSSKIFFCIVRNVVS